MAISFLLQIGFIGLVENDWIATLSSVDSDDVTYIDFVTLGRSLAQELRDEVRTG